jgi:glycosyltransferase involved in cell wall biosynthesis
MHILLIHQNFASIDEPGGTRHHEMALYLAERGHRVTIITSPVSYLTGSPRTGAVSGDSSSPQGSEVSSRVKIVRAYMYPALHRSFAHRVFSFFSFMLSSFWVALRVGQVDAVWGTSPPIFQGITAWAAARLKRIPFIFEVRDLWPAFAVQVGVLRQPVLIRAAEWLERFLYRHADRLIVNSPGFVEHVRQRGAHQIEVIPNGADWRMFDPAQNGLPFRRQKVPTLESKFIVLYAGAHGLSNDLGVVLEAARTLLDRKEIAFVLVGDGKEKPALVSQAEKLRLENVFFLPPVPKSEMPAALAAADACLAILKPVPLYGTVYPNKVFDYMAAGRPILLVMDGVIREVIEAAGAGIWSPPGDPQALAQTIKELAKQPDWGREMGRNGRIYLESHFDRAALAYQLAVLFESL